jgi:uncharacterized protein (TIGR00255 family)
LLEEYYRLVNEVKRKFSVENDIQLSDLLKREEFITVEEMEEENESLEHLVLQAVTNAASELRHMREKEGEQLKQDFLLHLKNFQQNVNELKKHAPAVVESYREKLERKIKENSDNAFDDSRILTEVAILSDKSDITEELTRLESHLKQFHTTIEDKGAIGRKLDFMIQEMNREVNTIGSKSNDSIISNIVVELKTTLEKLREQVQNVE